MTLPPRPPSPPLGPPCGTNFSVRKVAMPLPPLPAAASISTSSTNITLHAFPDAEDQTLKHALYGNLFSMKRQVMSFDTGSCAEADLIAEFRMTSYGPAPDSPFFQTCAAWARSTRRYPQ